MSEAPEGTRRGRILVVDDDPLIRLVSRQRLGVAGFDVVEADGGESALAAFAEQPPDLVLLDVEMPGMNGFEVCEAIRGMPAGRHVPILILTGLEDVESIEHAYLSGATDFASKPINWIVLAHRIRYILRASESFQAVRTQQVRLDEVQRYARLGSWEIDLASGQVIASSTLREMLGLDPARETITTDEALALVHADDRKALRGLFLEAIRDGSGFRTEHRVAGGDGGDRIMHTQARVRTRAPSPTPVLEGFSQDITERRRTEEQVRFLAYSDHLTGLPNRAGFKRHLEGTIHRAARTGRAAAVLFVDLDRFKRVNETLGHSAGDCLLQHVADQLAGCVRESDWISRNEDGDPEAVVSRLGGDDFTIILEDLAEPGDAGRVALRALETLQRPVLVEGHEISITASIGIAVWPHDGETVGDLLRNADSAMYHAKERGRANFQFYREELNADALGRFELESDLRHTIEREELRVHYQPKLELASGRIVGCEALVRWANPPGVSVPPEEFIPLAEASGLIDALGEQVLRQACAQARRWQREGHPDFKLAVNLSPSQLKNENLLESIAGILEETGFDPGHLELEITETALIHDEGPVRGVLEALRRHRVCISLDDFGTGYSSLSYLKRFPVQSLKIDKSFVGGIGTDSGDEAITAAILSIARDLGLRVVAEGIETEAQLRFLAERHCDDIQGFLISPPLPADEFEAFLRDHDAGDTSAAGRGPARGPARRSARGRRRG